MPDACEVRQCAYARCLCRTDNRSTQYATAAPDQSTDGQYRFSCPSTGRTAILADNFVEAKALFKTLAKLRPRDQYVAQQLALATLDSIQQTKYLVCAQDGSSDPT